MIKVTATELQNNFGKYLQYVNNDDIIILKNGKEIARLISKEKTNSFLCESISGILKNKYDDKQLKVERMKKYESID